MRPRRNVEQVAEAHAAVDHGDSPGQPVPQHHHTDRDGTKQVDVTVTLARHAAQATACGPRAGEVTGQSPTIAIPGAVKRGIVPRTSPVAKDVAASTVPVRSPCRAG